MWVCCSWLGEKLGAAVIVGPRETGHGEGVNVSLSWVESMQCFNIIYMLLLAEKCFVMRLLQQGGALDGFLAEIMRSRASSVCYLYKYLEPRSGGHAGWRKKQWLFKCCFAKGLYRSCLPNDPHSQPVFFRDKIFKCNCCLPLTFPKTSSVFIISCRFSFWWVFFIIVLYRSSHFSFSKTGKRHLTRQWWYTWDDSQG